MKSTSRWSNHLPKKVLHCLLFASLLFLSPGFFLHPVTAHAQGGTWSTKASMPTARRGLAGAQVNGVVYAIGGYSVAGGFSLPGSNEAYNPVTDTWSTKAAMPTPRYGLAAAALNGIVYAVGGNNGGTIMTTMEAYDPVTNTWSTKAAMPTARGVLAAVGVNGMVYAIGGSNGPIFNTVEAYNPGTNTWTTKAAMSTPRHALAAVEVNGIVYAIGGFNGSFLATMEAYDPATNTWSTKAAMPTARHVLVAVAVNGIIYAIGGINGSGGVDTVEAYDPVANTWSTKAAMPAVRYEVAAAAVNGTVYAVGGTSASGIDALATNEAFTPPPNTPVGPNIPVQPVDSGTGTSPVTLNFFTVTEGGTTSLTISGTGQPPPSGFKLGNPPQYFDLTTTAVFSGPITICINYTGINFGNESNAKLFHQEGGLWVDRTISVDTVNNIICASATSLSPFAIFEPAYAAEVQQPIDPDGSSVFNVKRGVVPVKFTITYGGSATCGNNLLATQTVSGYNALR